MRPLCSFSETATVLLSATPLTVWPATLTPLALTTLTETSALEQPGIASLTQVELAAAALPYGAACHRLRGRLARGGRQGFAPQSKTTWAV